MLHANKISLKIFMDNFRKGFSHETFAKVREEREGKRNGPGKVALK